MLNLNNLLNNEGVGTQEDSPKGNTGVKATAGQIKFYKDLCNQKSVEINPEHTNWTIQEMSSKINELLSMKKVIKASAKQIETIKNLSEQMNLPEPNEEILSNLPIDKASKMIEKLIARSKTVTTAPSEKQLEMIADMFKCPDVIITELIPVHKTLIKELGELTVANKKALSNKTKKTVFKGEVTTLKEIQDAIVKTKQDIEKYIVNFDLSKLDRKQVSDFIQDNSEKFYAWRDSRCSQAQKDFIRTLQERLATISHWSVNIDEIQTNIDGTPMYDINSPVKDELIVTGQYILTDDELNLFSNEQASQLIDMLQKELRDKELTASTPQEPEINDSLLRSITDINKANEKEQENIHNMIHSLYAMIGQQADDSILETTNLSEPLKDLIELCMLYTGIDGIKSTINNFVDSDCLFESLGLKLEWD